MTDADISAVRAWRFGTFILSSLSSFLSTGGILLSEKKYENMFFSRYVFIKISEHYVSFFMLWLVNGWLCLQYENIFSICPRWANNGDYEAKTMVARLTTEHYHGQHPAPARHAGPASCLHSHTRPQLSFGVVTLGESCY